MIIAIVQFPMPAGLAPDVVRERFAESVPRFQGLPGLLRKNYLYDPKAGTGGGAYLWESRAVAEAYYNEAWRERMGKMLGSVPSVTYFDSPVQVDNTVPAPRSA